jgi:hypothetical protein
MEEAIERIVSALLGDAVILLAISYYSVLTLALMTAVVWYFITKK